MTGDPTDFLARLKGLLPRWFPSPSPLVDALLSGLASAAAFSYSLFLYAKLQTRILTATDGWLDMIAADFFGAALARSANQSDASFRARIVINLFRERGTRAAISKVLLDLTGKAPIIFEPQRPLDTGAYGAAVMVSRASVATYFDSNGLMRTAPINVVRYDSVFGGLLVEAAATNLLLQSSGFDTSPWATDPNAGTTSLTTATAPDGSTNTVMITKDTNAGYRYQTPAVSAGTNTFSAYVKQGNSASNYVAIQIGNGFRAFYNFSTKALAVSASCTAQAITKQDVGNGWTRLSITAALSAGNTVCALCLSDATGTIFSAGSAVGTGHYFWGAQLESGATPTSYIPTLAAVVSRAADSLINNMTPGSAGAGGYGVAGGYGSTLLPFQAFVQAFRPATVGIPYVAGYGSSPGGYGVASRADYSSISQSTGAVTDNDIYSAIDSVKPAGTTLWAQIN